MVEIGDRRQEKTLRVPDHAEAVHQCLAQLTDGQTGCLKDASEVSAIAFKAVHGGRFERRAAGDARGAGRHGRDERRGAGPQPGLYPGHAAIERETAGDSPGGGLRDRFPSHHPRPQSLLRHSLRVGGKRAGATLRFPRGQPSLHRHAEHRTARTGLENDLLPPGRFQLAVRDSQRPEHGDQHGLQRPERAAADQPRRRFRCLCAADPDEAYGQVAHRSAFHAGQSGRADGAQRHQRRHA